MVDNNVYLPDGTLFASGFNRVVHGGRGDYVEFETNQILLPLISKFGNDISKDDLDIYYWWLYPKGILKLKYIFKRRQLSMQIIRLENFMYLLLYLRILKTQNNYLITNIL